MGPLAEVASFINQIVRLKVKCGALTTAPIELGPKTAVVAREPKWRWVDVKPIRTSNRTSDRN
jgi:hypothetical protein